MPREGRSVAGFDGVGSVGSGRVVAGLVDSGLDASGLDAPGLDASGFVAAGESVRPGPRGLPRASSRGCGRASSRESSLVLPPASPRGLPCDGARSTSGPDGAAGDGVVGRRVGSGASSRSGLPGAVCVGVCGRVGAVCRSCGTDGAGDFGAAVGAGGAIAGVRGRVGDGGVVGVVAAGGVLVAGAVGRASRGVACCCGAAGVRISRGCGAAEGREGAGALSRAEGAARGMPGCGAAGARVGAGAALGFEPPRVPPLAGGAARTLDASSVTPARTVMRVMTRLDDAERTGGTRLANARMRGPFDGSPTSIPKQVWISTLISIGQRIPC